MEAGPPTLVPLPIPHLVPLTTHPSGGTSEATAGAEYQTPTEEDRVTVSNFYCPHIPHVAEWFFGIRQGAPEAQDHHATGVSGTGKRSAGCVSGHKDGRILRKFRATKRL